MVRKIMDDFSKEDIPYDKNLKIGVMIETPAAAISFAFWRKIIRSVAGMCFLPAFPVTRTRWEEYRQLKRQEDAFPFLP